MNDNTFNAQLVNLHLDAYRKVISLIPAIKETVQKFDGKVFNKRLDTALKKIDDGLCCHRDYSSFRIEWYIENRYLCGKTDGNGCCGAYYLKENSIDIVWGSSYGNAYESACIPENKINAKVICELLDKAEKEFKDIIVRVEEQLPKVEALQAEKERIKKETEDFNRSIEWMVNNYFDLRID